MTTILFSRLIKDTLKKVSNEDFVMKASLDYIKQMSLLKDKIEENSKNKGNNVNEVLKDYKKASESIKMLSLLFKSEIKNYPTKLKSENDFDTLILIYLNENFMKLCNDKNLTSYYKTLHKIFNDYKKTIPLDVFAAISLRTLKIVDDFAKEGNYDAINRFIEIIKEFNGYINQNIIYIVYFGLFSKDDTFKYRNINYRKEYNKKVINSILNDNSILPDSIIKHLCTDKQFKGCKAGLLVFMINSIFMYTGYTGYEDYSLMINKILDNNLDDLNSEAKFFDLRKLYEMYEDYFNNKDSNYEIEKILSDIKCDNLVFYDVDDKEDSYGAI